MPEQPSDGYSGLVPSDHVVPRTHVWGGVGRGGEVGNNDNSSCQILKRMMAL